MKNIESKNNNIWLLVAVMVVVGLAAGVIGANVTGNFIVVKDTTGKSSYVYTAAEANRAFYNKTEIDTWSYVNFINQNARQYRLIYATTYQNTPVIAFKGNIKSGHAEINLLYGDGIGGGTKFLGTGGGPINQLRTSNTDTIKYNLATDEFFIASSDDLEGSRESYLLKATLRSSAGVNYATIKDAISGTSYCRDKREYDTCIIGNLALKIQKIDLGGMGVVTISNSGSFNKIYTTDGNFITLPDASDMPVSSEYTFNSYDANDRLQGYYRAYFNRYQEWDVQPIGIISSNN